jgi:2-dehydropantoate 2-reductase
MKYAVIGLGAVGTIIGGLLAKSGEKIIFICKKNQVEEIRKKGIKINGINNSIVLENVQVSSDLSLISDSDVIIICVKSYDTKYLAEELKKFIKKSSVIISLQNGVRNSKILKDVTGNTVLSGIILFNALYILPGEVTLTLKGGLILETNSLYKETIKSFIEVLNKSGIESKLEIDIEDYLWSKLVVNLQNAVTALTGQTIKESILNKDSRAIIIATMNEGLNILQKSKIPYKTLPDIDPKVSIRRLKILNSVLLKFGSRILKLDESARSSMWQSLYRGRPTEIDYINGEIVNLAKKYNLVSPINKKLVELVKEAEKTNKIKSYEPSELKEILNIK